MIKQRYICLAVVVAMAAGLAQAARGPNPVGSQNPGEDKLIATLQSDAPPAQKAITCKLLAIYGTPKAVPALAALLPDAELSSWARIALEDIPGAAADDALREATGKVQGRLLIGVINSIGYRRDAKAVDVLVQKMKDADADVASAAAAAVGRIGGAVAGKALEQALATAPVAVRSAVAEGCVLCAERFVADGNRDEAIKLYDAVRKATDVPKQRILEGTRGAILARQSAGIPLLVEQLRSSDRLLFYVGLATARELPGDQVTDALLAELTKATPERQALLILALADRGDAKALPAVLERATAGATNVKIAAVGVLERIGNASCVPVLLDAAVSADAQLAQAARATLTRLAGKEVDAELLARLQQPATGVKARPVIIELVEQRRIDGALPIFVRYAEDADAAVRAAAIVAIGSVGEAAQSADLARMLQKSPPATERAAIEKALMSIGGRYGAECAKHLLPLAQSADSATRLVALNALACSGGSDALAAVVAAVADKDETVQDEAVRTLSTWPNRWPEDAAVTAPLLTLAKSGAKVPHRVLAIRGYLQFVQGTKKLTAPERLAKVNEISPLITRPEEKRLAVSVLGAIGTAGSLAPLTTFAADEAVCEEACTAIVNVIGRGRQVLPADVRTKALQTVVEKTKNDATKQRAEALLKGAR